MTAEMKKLLSEAFVSNKIPGVVITGVENPALSAEAAKYGIDAQKYELILAYLALGGKIKDSEYASVSVRELYAEISKLQKKNKIDKLETEAGEAEEKLFETISDCIGGFD